MLQSAVVGALSQEIVKDLAQAVADQSRYYIQFPGQFKELQDQLDLMQAFVADTKMQQDIHTVKILSSKLQELIYAADDLVTDCQIRSDYQKTNEPSCHPLSFSEVVFRYRTGKKLTELNNEILKMRGNLSSYGTIGKNPSVQQTGPRQVPQTLENLDKNQVVGLVNEVETMRKWILGQEESEPLLLIGIVGMGGLGKTTLAKMIARDENLRGRFQKKIWISISQTVDDDHIMASILEQLEGDDGVSSKGTIMSRISNLLAEGTYLIVFDDVWRGGDSWWEQIRNILPKTEGHKNCVIITSRNRQEVKRMGVKEARIHRQRFLSKEESWDLFCRIVSSGRDEPTPSDLLDIGEKIVEKCRGLPLAIKTIGSLMSIVDQTVAKWELIYENFHTKLSAAAEGDSTRGSPSVIASLRTSYDELTPQLKQCLLSFSIYPEDHEIDADQLVHWWDGEGFVRSRGHETVTESALICLSELISRSLVEVFRRRDFDGSALSCKMHDMVREMAIDIAKEEGFSTFDHDGRNIANQNSRRLGVTKETTFQSLKGNSNLRALLLTSWKYIAFNRKIELAKIKCLRVLDLSNVSLVIEQEQTSIKDFWNWITSQKRLAYLNLRGVENLDIVPDAIGKLWGLKVLILGECNSLQNLPETVTKLPRLIVLDVSNCSCIQYLPKGIHRLSNLQELYGFKIPGQDNPQGSSFGELKALTRLRNLHLEITEESTIEKEELAILKDMTKLRVISINAGECEKTAILQRLDELEFPDSIQELYLKNYFGETTPPWISRKVLPKLQFLCIEDSRLKTMSPAFLDSKGQEWNVKGLCLKFCRTLSLAWEDLQIVMPKLKHREISQCDCLEGFPCDDIKSMGSWSDNQYKEKYEKSEDPLPAVD